MSAGQVLVTCRQMQVELPVHLERLTAAGLQVSAPPVPGQQFSEDELIALLPGVVGVIAGDDPFTRRVLESSDDLRVIVRWGIGMDSVDAGTAEERGVALTNTPAVFGDEVADSAMAYVLLLARGHHRIDAGVRAGEWPAVEGVSLSGAVLGVVGLGSIGLAIARRAKGFGMQVMAFDPYADPETARAAGAALVALDELLTVSRFVVLAAPLTDATRHLMDKRTIGLMRPDAFLVNVGRGPLIDESALVDALSSDAIAGAGLDVFEVEPLPRDHALRSFGNVVLGAHNGSNTRQGVARASAEAVDRLLALLDEAT